MGMPIGVRIGGERMKHELKTWPEYFEAVISGKKTFEIRKNDRDFKVGDLLLLKEFFPEAREAGDNGYSGEECLCEVTYILNDGIFLPEEYACMSIKVLQLPTASIV